jgi:hypothetical protein
MSTLPPEITEGILSNLSPSSVVDLTTLLSCNAVSHIFRSICRPILWGRICLSNYLTVHGFRPRRDVKVNLGTHIIRNLWLLLEDSPYLARFIRELYVDSDIFGYYPGGRLTKGDVHLLEAFSYIEELYIFGVESHRIYNFAVSNPKYASLKRLGMCRLHIKVVADASGKPEWLASPNHSLLHLPEVSALGQLEHVVFRRKGPSPTQPDSTAGDSKVPSSGARLQFEKWKLSTIKYGKYIRGSSPLNDPLVVENLAFSMKCKFAFNYIRTLNVFSHKLHNKPLLRLLCKLHYQMCLCHTSDH